MQTKTIILKRNFGKYLRIENQRHTLEVENLHGKLLMAILLRFFQERRIENDQMFMNNIYMSFKAKFL